MIVGLLTKIGIVGIVEIGELVHLSGVVVWRKSVHVGCSQRIGIGHWRVRLSLFRVRSGIGPGIFIGRQGLESLG